MVQPHARTDAKIQKEVLRELAWDSAIEATDVGVEVDGGVVTLTGTVSSYLQKWAAEQAAHRVRDVCDVANDIVVKAPGFGMPTDTELAQRVRRVLEEDPLVPHAGIVTTVSNGWITLGGQVELPRQIDDAERGVRSLVGVRGITNNITVSPPRRAPDPDALRRAIEDALTRQAERVAAGMQLTVEAGTATLSGQVRTSLEKLAVLDALGHAPGVRRIVDEVRIDPSL